MAAARGAPHGGRIAFFSRCTLHLCTGAAQQKETDDKKLPTKDEQNKTNVYD
jgi:hypothetical protein